MSIGLKIKSLRVDKKLSLNDVAEAVGVSKTHIWKLERGESDNPSIDLVKKLAEYFKVSIISLVDDKDDVTSEFKTIFFRKADQLDDDKIAKLEAIMEELWGEDIG